MNVNVNPCVNVGVKGSTIEMECDSGGEIVVSVAAHGYSG